MKDKVFKFYVDSQHGWLAVKFKYIQKLGIEHQISSHSYVSKTGQTVYLEEDCDAGVFIKAFTDHTGHPPKLREGGWVQHSHIRGYERYKVKK